MLPLNSSIEEDRKYYVDLSEVRGARLFQGMERQITTLSPNKATCQLFTGRIGCGKSTELLRLKYLLEQQNFHVVYFESDRVLELADVAVSDVLLAIAGQISSSLESKNVIMKVPETLKKILGELKDLLQSPVDFGVNFKLSLGIAEITAQSKKNDSIRRQIRERLESRISKIINAINDELLEPAKRQLQSQGMKGLVVIVDNLDRIENRIDDKDRNKAGYLFVERSDLRELKCHVLYTVPFLLTFSNDAAIVEDRFGTQIKTLPMIPTSLPDGSECLTGMALLRQIVMSRAFPSANSLQRVSDESIAKVFENPQTLDRLCQVSGGHVRDLFRLLSACLQQEDPPITRELLENTIASERNSLVKKITEDEWTLIRKVHQAKQLSGESEYQTLIRSKFVFEYEYKNEGWFDVNPILASKL
ncbi:KAP family NTPase [Pseudanabaena sp. ABRG5-3]|uniref:KAP family NTPase n=1 Tax=Pseudanabaena sp. ABRG5-3 TaxID=685565 RepID=UPI000DC71857|nr:KAP family NTPase [Pseudanabaena sp. ABRG5-3]BBC26470.1 hypothetical protein ABRG53_4213 [Pseudanabaena sp. ABRG5-3]